MGEESPDNTECRTICKSGFRWAKTESVTEKIPPWLAEVRVKTCGKSARLQMVTFDGDKPFGLQCHVHPMICKDLRLLASKQLRLLMGGVGSVDK